MVEDEVGNDLEETTATEGSPVYFPTNYYGSGDIGALNRVITAYQPVPIPEWLGDWHIDTAELLAPTPQDYHASMTNDAGKVMYYYVPIEFVIYRLNKATASPFGPQWGLELVHESWGPWLTRKSKNGDYRCRDFNGIWQLVWPGQFRPIAAAGSSTFFENNAQESEAKTRNAAQAFALKACAKQIGIGRDVEKDDPDTQKLVNSRVSAIQTTFDQLAARGAQERAARAVADIASEAVTKGNALLIDKLAFADLEPVQTALAKLAVAVARESKAPSAKS